VPSGFPWQISLVQPAGRTSYAGLAPQLALVNLVTTEELSRCRNPSLLALEKGAQGSRAHLGFDFESIWRPAPLPV
jgi:hypothetical protein